MNNKNTESERRAKLLALRQKRLNEMKKQSSDKLTSKQGNHSKDSRSTNKVKLATTTRHGELVRAQRMVASDVNMRASQHIVNIPVNKSIYNGYKGQQVSPTQLKRMKPSADSVKIIPLGGVGETGIGKNITVIEYQNEIIVIDMGVIFSDGNYPGVNYMTPDVEYLLKNQHKIKAFAFTHAHLDHIGACKHLLPLFNHLTPIYGTTFTLNMIKRQMSELSDVPELNYVPVDPALHQEIKVSQNLSIELIHTLHSIPGNAAIVVRTPNGVITYMGDWRFENDPVSPKFNMERLLEISQKEGIELLINESTNIDSPGSHPVSEFAVGENIGKIMDEYAHGRVIVSSFSSQITRIQLVLNEAAKRGRKVAFAGYSMINNLEVALRSKEIKVPKNTIVKMEDIVKLPDSKVAIICTGSQGELNAVLNRMATGAHKFIKIKPTDVVIFSSNPIPGNEHHVSNTVDGLMREGSHVVQNSRGGSSHNIGPIHLSGHAYYDDHVKLVTTLRPRNYLPNHGQFYMLEHNAEMAENVAGIKRDNILVSDNGDIVELTKDRIIKKAGRVRVGSDLYDNTGNKVHDAVVKDRLHISNEGIFIIVLTLNKKTGRLAKTPDVVSRAFVYLDDSEELIGKIRHYLRTKTDQASGSTDLPTLKQEIKDDVSHLLFDSTGHTPIVIPVVNRV